MSGKGLTCRHHLERVSRGEFGELLVAGQCGGKAEEGEEVAAFAFVSHGKAAVAEQPGYGSLDLPPVPSQVLGRLYARARYPGGDAAPAQPGDGLSGMIGLVAAELAGAAVPRPAPGAGGRHCLNQRLERVAVVDIGSRDPDGQRDALRLAQHVQLAARLPAIDGVRASQRAPFFARTDAASMITEVQSSSPRAPSSSSSARCSRHHSPALVHCPKRRCAVWNGTPNDGGRSPHAHPLVMSTMLSDGSIHSVAMFHGFADDNIAFLTKRKSQKVRNILRAPKDDTAD
jgi:hypothetical protein